MWRSKPFIAITGLIAAWCVGAAPSFFSVPGEWIVEHRIVNSLPATVRINLAYQSAEGRGDYPYLITVTSKFNIKTENGFPAKGEQRELDDIEETLEEQLVDAKHALPAAVITGDNQRQFWYYAQDGELIRQAAARVAREVSHHTLSVEAALDPDWERFVLLLKN